MWLDDFRAHALAEYPRECCGLLVAVKRKERYFPCRNIGNTGRDRFVLSPEDYAAAEDVGDVIAVCHSHPDVAARPSEADKVACEATYMPWYIASVCRDLDGPPAVTGVHRFEPCGYEAPLVGREFVHGVLDCYALVRDFYARELRITLPDFERKDDWWNDGHSSLYLDNFRAAGCEPVPQGESLQRGDIILMQIRSGNGVPNHAGVYLGDGQMLHHLYGRLSSREVYGGWFQERTRLIVRHVGAMLASPEKVKQEGAG